ncbi:NAD(P)/FAD-dependent oxidoreductase [Ectothiorhodospiraceae bacterium 2226]|nr:NAD(P)/FAD-dependent oxidoreductase [Ectothiorhodospiraceae bacterium 2226]
MERADVVVIGAGAAGLMCAIEAGRRGRRVLVLEHARKAGNKIRMSGGGRCNFTNYHVGPEHYLCANPHFVKSALSRYTQWDFIALVERHGVAYHEREHGQLFCDESSKAILDLLLAECQAAGVRLHTRTEVDTVARTEAGFRVESGRGAVACTSLVVATGGLSIPSMGASPFGYRIAEQFGLAVHPPTAGLVPFTLQPEHKTLLAPLAGVSAEAQVQCGSQAFRGGVLFTHRGLSGPAMLQISSYWRPGAWLDVDWLPEHDLQAELHALRAVRAAVLLKTVLARHLPARAVPALLGVAGVDGALTERPLRTLAPRELTEVARALHGWRIQPAGTEGYRTAEVTLGGVDCDAVSSQTFEARDVAGLYFVGEVLDVAGWLGGYNFQWAWSSGWCAGQYV